MSWTQTITLDAPQLELRKPEEYLHLVVRLKGGNAAQAKVAALLQQLDQLKIFAPLEEQKLQAWQVHVPLKLFSSYDKLITPVALEALGFLEIQVVEPTYISAAEELDEELLEEQL
jgi:hypothetical protein